MNIEEIKEKIDKSKENHRYNITSSREWFENLLDYITNLQQENKQLKELCNKYEEEHKTTFGTWLKGQKVLTELEEWLKYQFEHTSQQNNYYSVLDKIQKLKEKYK